MTRLVAAALAAAVLAGLAGCGGGSDEPETVSKDLYIAEADSVCSDLADSFRGAGKTDPKTAEQVAESADLLADLYGELLTRLRDVKLPTRVADRAGATAYVAAVGRTGELLGGLRSSASRLQDAVDAKDARKVADAGIAVRSALDGFRSAQAQANRRALAYGFNLCGNLN